MFNALLGSHLTLLVPLDILKSDEEQLYSWYSKKSI